MSFVSAVVSSAQEIELTDFNKKVPDLKNKILNVKSDVTQYLNEVYLKYCKRPQHVTSTLQEVDQMKEELAMLQKYSEDICKRDLSKVNSEVENHMETLKNINAALSLTEYFININEELTKFTELNNSNDYMSHMMSICTLKEIIRKKPESDHMELLINLCLSVDEKETDFIINLTRIFDECVKQSTTSNTLKLKIKKDTVLLQNALTALYFNNSSIVRLQTFSESLFKKYFIPIIEQEADVKTGEDDTFNIFTLTTSDSKATSNYLHVIENLKILIKFLRDNLDFPITSNDKETVTVLTYIARGFQDNLSEVLCKNCFEPAIPTTIDGFKMFQTNIERIHELNKLLKESNIFTDDIQALSLFIENIDLIFIKKKCQEHIVTAEALMKKDLHEMVEVGEYQNPDSLLQLTENAVPQCSVSKSVIELVQFLEILMMSTLESSSLHAEYILNTVQNIVGNYGTFVCTYHNKMLKTIPQQVAVFYNNCHYIAHVLTEWNLSYCLKLTAQFNIGSFGFVKEITNLKEVSSELFSNFVSTQLDQIEEIMKESNIQNCDVDLKVERHVRQCLRHQELLKTVWHKVLPYNLYNNTMGNLLNALCRYIINVIVKFEDISLKVSQQLTDLLQLIVNRGPKLFTEPNKVAMYVKSWDKFNELIFILSATLIDIRDRWADGKGPLAMHFTVEEMKNLIRALFQNTDFRASILKNITK